MILQHPKLPPWTPPANYQPVDSALEGVSVFAPRPEAPKAEDAPATFVCPNCAATLAYDVAAGGVACEYCGYTAPAAVEVLGREAESFEFTLNTLKKVEQGWGIERQLIHCDTCSASFSPDPGQITATCTFCGSNQVNIVSVTDDHLRPRFLVPFKIEKQQLRDSIQKWLGQGWYHPGELAQSAGVQKRITGVYIPFWTFDADIDATWEAEIGYDEQERYYEDGEWKTRTVTRWRWENGRVNTPIRDMLISGSTHISNLLLQRAQPFDLKDLVAYSPDFLAGWQAHAYDVSLTDAWEDAKARMRDRAKDACYRDHSGDHIRNFSMVADFDDESWRYVLLPIYLASYRYDDKPFQVMVNGQTGKVVGQKPVAWWKIWAAIALLFTPGICMGLAGLPLLLASGIGIVPLVIGFILIVVAVFGAIWLYNQATQSEAA